ncbi:hypothetical protein V7S43_017077 [Phytophthora oleae]|uniref:Peptidase C1A papain C-terminal domain-containing protein n=1 Tax=Phytophthora oleae TaxID=2107226 RepID=A0ABD3EU53_9STRA
MLHNSKEDKSFTMELNEFADIMWDEFQSWYLGGTQEEGLESRWGSENQGNHYKLKHGEPTTLPEQNLLECAQNFDNHGCNGGLPSHAFEYVKYNGGLDTEETYPYEAKEGKCKFNTYHVGAQVDQVVNITSRNENELNAAVGSVGPVSIAFQGRLGLPVLQVGCDVNHAVLAVGYDVENGKNHWIVKNSWGTEWGMVRDCSRQQHVRSGRLRLVPHCGVRQWGYVRSDHD